MVFRNAVSGHAVCAAFGASFLIGKCAASTGMVINEPQMNTNHAEKVFRYLGACHDPLACLSPPGAAPSYTCGPCGDGEPMPDYENVLTD